MKTTIQQNRNLIDYAEYYDLVYGTEANNTELNSSLRKRVLEALFEIHTDSFPNNQRAVKECILQGQEIRDPQETQYLVKRRFIFAQDLYNQFLSEVVYGKYVYDSSGYATNEGALKNTQVQCHMEWTLAWELLTKAGLQEKFFHRMARRKIEEFLFNASGQKLKAPNQAWMDLFGLNEGVCQALRAWFDENLLLTA